MNCKQSVAMSVLFSLLGQSPPGLLGQSVQTLEQLQRPSLRGLKGVEVLASAILPDNEAQGFTRSRLQSDIETRLRTAGIGVLTPEESVTTPGSPFLHVKVFSQESELGGFVCRIAVDLHQDVVLERDPSVRVIAATWRTEWIGALRHLTADGVREKLNVCLDRFIADYSALNPGDPP